MFHARSSKSRGVAPWPELLFSVRQHHPVSLRGLKTLLLVELLLCLQTSPRAHQTQPGLRIVDDLVVFLICIEARQHHPFSTSAFVCIDVLIDAFVADCHLTIDGQITRYLFRAPQRDELTISGYMMGEFIREHGLNTAVSGYCISACSMMFMGGQRASLFRRAAAGKDLCRFSWELLRQWLAARRSYVHAQRMGDQIQRRQGQSCHG